MSKNTFNIDDARKALDALESKVDLLADAVENKISSEQTPTLQKAAIKKSTIKKVEMPSDIEVDSSDKYNTQPKNSALYHFNSNYRMFARDARKNLFQSKLFWFLIVLLPLIISLIEYIFAGWGVSHASVVRGGLVKVTADYINSFFIMPLTLMSLIIFPSFIATSRETNQLKRYTMKGMSRKQIYYSYMRFSLTYLTLLIFFWMGPWMIIMNLAVDSIWGNGIDPVFNNPWGLFFGMDHSMLKVIKDIDTQQTANYLNSLAVEQGVETWENITGADVYNSITNNSTSSDEGYKILMGWFGQLGIKIDEQSSEALRFILMNNEYTTTIINESNSIYIIEFDTRIRIAIPTYHDGIQEIAFFTLFILISFGINSVGFNKAMKVKSSRVLMGWGIGLWLFASIVQGSVGLLYEDLYKFDAIDKAFWNYFVMVLLMFLKWMFLLSPVTIMIVGLSFTTGWVVEPTVFEGFTSLPNGGEQIYQLQEWLINLVNTNPGLTVSQVYWVNNIIDYIDAVDSATYNPIIDPSLTTKIFYGLSAFWAMLWTFKTWMFKSRIVSYEAAR